MSFKIGPIRRFLTGAALIITAIILGTTVSGAGILPASADSLGIDLTVDRITLSPADPAIGDTVSIIVNIKNLGTEPAGLSYVVCYVDATILTTETINSLAGGTSTTRTFTWEAQPGLHTITAIADSSSIVPESDESNNTSTFTLTTLAPDLVIQSVTWSPSNPSRNDNVVFTLTIKNQGNGKSRSTDVNLFIDGNTMGYRDIAAIDPGKTTTATYDWRAKTGQHAIKTIVDERDYVAESDENNNENTLTFSTFSPDLVITSITWSPQSPSKNDLVYFFITVTNQGYGRAGACNLGLYINGELVSLEPVSSIEGGYSTQVTPSLVITTNTIELKAIIDLNENVTESDDSNNEYTVNVSTVAPDLIVKDISWTPEDAAVGDIVTFTVTIKNQGKGTADPTRAAYYVGGAFSGYLEIPELETGEEYVTTFECTALLSTLTVKLFADVDNRIVESSERNNSLGKTIPIVLPDLYIYGIDWSPQNPALDDIVTFTVTVENNGGGRADAFYIGYYVDDILLHSDIVYGLASGDYTSRTYTWQAQNGRHTFKAMADIMKTVPESEEKNNENSVTIIPYMADLVIGSVTWSPADTPPGDEVTFDIDIENQGSLSAGLSRVTYYVDDTIVGYTDIEQLEAYEMVTKHFLWMATVGFHTIDIVVDSINQVTEIDENNNSKHIDIPPPDLVIEGVTWSPEDASIGDTVTFTATITNRGKSKNQGTQITWYIDDWLVATQDLGRIEPGNFTTSPFEWVAESGEHYIGVSVDIDNVVTETNETNNDFDVEFSTLTPDLVIEKIDWYMENALLDNDATFTIDIKNQGNDAAGESALLYFIDYDDGVYADIPVIPAGGNATITILTSLEPGTHAIGVYIDVDDVVEELNETNNDDYLFLYTVIPDLIVKSITLAPVDAAPGDTVTITVKIENQGRENAPETGVSLSVNGTILGYVDIDAIDMGAIAPVDFSWTAEAGENEFTAFVDYGETIPESNEYNNSKSRTVTVEQPEQNVTPVKMADVSSSDKGLLDSWWWAILVAGLLLSGTAFVTALKAIRKG